MIEFKPKTMPETMPETMTVTTTCTERLRPQPADFSEIEPIWRDRLWRGRESVIEPVSAIGPDGTIDLGWREATPRFWKVVSNGETVAVLSTLSRSSVRLRGLWVDESMRGAGLGKRLVEQALGEATTAPFAWTMARATAERFYASCGFERVREIEGYELGPHVLMIWRARS